MAIATKRKSTLAVKLELSSAVGTTASSSGTTVTFVADHSLSVGDVVGNSAKGYRTVTSVTSATVVEVDSAYIADLSTEAVYKQAYATDPTIAAGDVIEYNDCSLESDNSEIARQAVNRSYDDFAPIVGPESVGGGIDIELHGSGSAGTAPESFPLWMAAVGEMDSSQSSTTTSGSTTTSVKLTANGGAKFKVGHHIVLDPTAGGTGAYEVARVTAIATDDLTVSPALSEAPPTGRAVGAGVHFKPTLTELHSLWAQYWRGDITLEKYKGLKCASLALDFSNGQTVNPKFTFKGQSTATPTSAAYTLGATSGDSGTVHVARYMVVKMAGTLYSVSNVNITITNDLYERQDVTSSGIKSIIRTKRTVTGSFKLLYENSAIETAFKNGTTAELMVVSSAGGSALTLGNTFVLSMPKIKYTKAAKSEDNGLYAYDVSFKAVRTNGEDSVFMSFL